MMKTQVLLLEDASDELIETLERDGPIQYIETPPVHLARTPDFEQYRDNLILSPDQIRGITTSLKSALTCISDASELPNHELEVVAIALQLVKPTRNFCKYCVRVDDSGGIQQATADMQFLRGVVISDPYLCYQQHHTITADDATRAIRIVPTLLQVMEQGHGSWGHPFGSIHRAVTFFAQGYSVALAVLRQVLWAAGLDCLFASKLHRHLRGAKTISGRLQKLFGHDFNPYHADTVKVPFHQKRPPFVRLDFIGEHILWLRNAYIHGLRLNANWLPNQGDPEESGYAYLLCECTEILLRVTLLRILEDSMLLETFKDPVKLDNYFQQ